jgi:hypothetical protein
MMADDKYRLLPLRLAEWENKMRERQEEEAERERVDPVFTKARADALKEEARLAEIEIKQEAKREWFEDAHLAQIEVEEEAKRKRIEIEEEAKRKWYEDVRLTVATILEEEAKPGADAKMRRVLMERARAAKAAKAAKAAEAGRKAKAAEIERLVPMVKAAFVLSGRRKLSITDKCVSQIRPHLPKEKQCAPVERLKEAIRTAKDRG